MLRDVIEKEFSVDGRGRRILQCHSRGARRYSPFNCYVTVWGEMDSIENHYHRAKVFEGGSRPRDWREAKRFKKEGLRQTGWQIGHLRVPCRSNPKGTSFLISDLGVQFYVLMWRKHLRAHPEKIAYASAFEDFCDPFAGDFPCSQAEVIRISVREGLDGLTALCTELLHLLSRPDGAPVTDSERAPERNPPTPDRQLS